MDEETENAFASAWAGHEPLVRTNERFVEAWAGLDDEDRDELWHIASDGAEPSERLWNNLDALPGRGVEVWTYWSESQPIEEAQRRRVLRQDFRDWLNEHRSDPGFPT